MLDGPRESQFLRRNGICRSLDPEPAQSRRSGTSRAELEQYRFDHAAGIVYQFIWHEYCDWYLELIKPRLQNPIADASRTNPAHACWRRFETMMRLLHPFMPFLTEEIWQALPHEGDSIVVQPYPMPRKTWHVTRMLRA